MKNLLLYIGLPHLKLKPLRSFLTLIGVSFGIALYVAIAIINHSTKNSMKESIDAVAGKAKLIVTAGPVGFDEKKISIIKNVPGVKFAIPMVEARAYFADTKEPSGSLYVLGVDLLQEQSIRSYKSTDNKVIDDPLIFFNQPDSIIITKKLAVERKLEVNSKISLATANGIHAFTIRGLLEPEGAARAYGGSLAIMDIDGAMFSFGKGHKIDRADIVPETNYSIDEIKLNLTKALGPGFLIETPELQSSQLEAMVGSQQMMLTFFSSIALLAGLFLIINSISIAVTERRKEIGILRALGATRFSMVWLFVIEVIGTGLLGSIFGCLLGRVLAEALSKQVVSAMATQFQMQITVNELEFTTSDIAFSILIGTAASIFAAFWPSLKAAKIHPLESMKGYLETHQKDASKFANNLMILGFIILAFVTVSSIFSWGKHSMILNILTNTGSVVGPAILGPYIVLLFLGLLEKAPRGTFSTVFHFAHENLLRNPKRTFSNVMALLVGLFLVMLIATIRISFHDTLMGWLDQTFVSDLLITSNGRVATSEVQALSEKIQGEILTVPGIRPLGIGRGSGMRAIRIPYQGKQISLKAMDRFADFYESRYIASPDTESKELINRLFESKKPLLLASENFLLQQKLKNGDTINLDTPNGRIPFQIGGTISDYAPNGVIYMDRKVYKKYWNDSLISAFAFNILPGYTLEQVRSDIDRRFGRKRNLMVISNAEFKLQTQQAIEQSFAYTKAIEFIALIVGLLGLLNTMLISVIERTREIGVLRAVGSVKGQISKMIILEAILQGFLGGFVAIILGSYIGWLYIKYNLVESSGWIIDFHLAFSAIIYTMLTGILVSIIAGYFPSKKASSLVITEALDYK